MKRVLVLALALALALGSVVVSSAFSFVGADWELSYEVVYRVRTAFGNDDILDSVSGEPVTVSQSVADSFSFPYSVGVVQGTGDFTVSGTTVTDTNGGKTTDPFPFLFGGDVVTVRLTYSDWNLTGEVTGVNAGATDAFGARAYAIMGAPVTISDVKVEALLSGVWVDLGTDSSVDVTAWSMQRPVPEPATLAVLGVAALGWFGRRRRG